MKLNNLIKEEINKYIGNIIAENSNSNDQFLTNYVNKQIKNGVEIHDIFDNVFNMGEFFSCVELKRLYNIIDDNGNLLSDYWFNSIGMFKNGLAYVELDGKYNFINKNGDFLSNQWFDYADNFENGFAYVKMNDKCNFINKNGEFISNKWFDYADNFENGFARVKLDGKEYEINTDGKIIY